MARPKKDHLDTDMQDVSEMPLVVDHTKLLNDAARNQIIKKLQAFGLTTDKLNDQELLDALSTYAEQMTSKAISRETDELSNHLEYYAEGTLLTDMEFIEQLFKWSVPKNYLLAEYNLIRNEDKVLSKDDLWTKIRYSGIRPYDDYKEILKPRYKLPKKDKSLAASKLRR